MIDWGRLKRDRRAQAGVVGASVLVVAGIGGWLLAGSGSPAASPTPTVSATSTPSPSPSPRPTRRPTPSPSPSPTATPMPEALEDGRLTILVLGSDSDASRRARGKAFLTDAITVVSIDGDGSDAVLVSLPRDTVDLPMPGGGTWTGKVNSVTVLRSPELMRDMMALLLGITIDHYVLVDMDDFRRLVDAVGGVTVSVPYTLSDKRCTIPSGTQTLGGDLALCFARHRTTDSDYARAGRHQQLLIALRDRIVGGEVDLGELAGVLPSLRTDIPLESIATFAPILAAAADAPVEQLVLSPPAYTTFVGIAGARGWISVPNVPAIQAAVDALISD